MLGTGAQGHQWGEQMATALKEKPPSCRPCASAATTRKETQGHRVLHGQPGAHGLPRNRRVRSADGLRYRRVLPPARLRAACQAARDALITLRRPGHPLPPRLAPLPDLRAGRLLAPQTPAAPPAHRHPDANKWPLCLIPTPQLCGAPRSWWSQQRGRKRARFVHARLSSADQRPGSSGCTPSNVRGRAGIAGRDGRGPR